MSGEVQQLLRERESGGDERREHRKILSPVTATEAIAIIIKPCWHWNRVERRRDTRSNRISQSLNESRCARGTCFKW